MKKKTLLVAFSTQKGGIGKSALTVLMAGYFHYIKGYNVGVIDCDYAQFSIFNMRERDRKVATTVDHYKLMVFNQLKNQRRRPYPILKSMPIQAVSTAEKMIQESDIDLDVVFFDLPGTLNSEGILSADRMVLQSTLEFASLLNENIISTAKGNIQGLYLLWNQVDGREKTDLYDTYEDIITELGLPVMKNFLPDTKRFRHELSEEIKPVFRCTLLPTDKQLIKGSNVDLLADEIEEIIKLKADGEER